MKVFGNRVLVEQIMTKKKSIIINPGGGTNPDQFDVTQKVIELGTKFEGEIQIGDVPIFAKYADLGNTKILSKTEDKIITHIIVHNDDIIGKDDADSVGVTPIEKKEA